LSQSDLKYSDIRICHEDSGIREPGKQEEKTQEEKFVMKALRYFFCVVLPPLAVLMTGRIASFFLSLILTLLGWIPGVIHACLVVNDYHAEQRSAAR